MKDNDVDDDINLMQHLEKSKAVATRGKPKINTTGRTHVARKVRVNSVGLLLDSEGFQVDAKWRKSHSMKGMYILIRGGLHSGEAVRMLRFAIALTTCIYYLYYTVRINYSKKAERISYDYSI